MYGIEYKYNMTNNQRVNVSVKLTLLILYSLFINHTLTAQKKLGDSTLVQGQLKWSNDSIKYFPKKVVIKSKYHPTSARCASLTKRLRVTNF